MSDSSTSKVKKRQRTIWTTLTNEEWWELRQLATKERRTLSEVIDEILRGEVNRYESPREE